MAKRSFGAAPVLLACLLYACTLQCAMAFKRRSLLATALNPPMITCAVEPNGTSSAQLKVNVTAVPTADGTYAPAGFSLQWVEAEFLNRTGTEVWPLSDDICLCKASFSGVPGSFSLGGTPSSYNLVDGQTVEITIDGNMQDRGATVALDKALCELPQNPLDPVPEPNPKTCPVVKCGRTYKLRAFSHNVPNSIYGKSSFGETVTCKVLDCPPAQPVCTHTQGYFKTHTDRTYIDYSNPTATKCKQCVKVGQKCSKCNAEVTSQYASETAKGNNFVKWPCPSNDVEAIKMGNHYYSYEQCLSIFHYAPQGNSLSILAHQLITARLNERASSGATLPQEVQDALAAADLAISNNVIPPFSEFTTINAQTVTKDVGKEFVNTYTCPNSATCPSTSLAVSLEVYKALGTQDITMPVVAGCSLGVGKCSASNILDKFNNGYYKADGFPHCDDIKFEKFSYDYTCPTQAS